MKTLFILFAVAISGCANTTEEAEMLAEQQLQAQQQMEEKVRDVTEQLRSDCDSTLLQMARMKVDSIKRKHGIVTRSRSTISLKK